MTRLPTVCQKSSTNAQVQITIINSSQLVLGGRNKKNEDLRNLDLFGDSFPQFLYINFNPKLLKQGYYSNVHSIYN